LARRDDHGAPSHGRATAAVGAVVALTIVIGVVAYLIGEDVATPAQQAARTRAPRPSLLTAPVERTRARTAVVLRGTLVDGAPISVGVPNNLDGDLAVVSAVGASRGTEVRAGSLIAAVAGRPVFVMPGQIPAYAEMSYGSSGAPVVELQAALARLGLSTAPDRTGIFGAGTAAAVGAFYSQAGYAAPTTSLIVSKDVGTRRRFVTTRYPSVPLGEIAFVSGLPAEVVSARSAGQTLGTSAWLAKLGSGRLAFSVTTNVNTASLLRVGVTGHAKSDYSSGSVAIRLSAKRRATNGTATRLTFVPVSLLSAAPYIGQNMALRVSTGAGGLQWVVPVSAVVTNAAGASSVTVLHGAKQVPVPVQPGLAFAGSEVVRPTNGGLAVGDEVVIGLGS
jgi:peptidoglycan hydrolase-like protein with peptidoglycan-binding domain